MQVPPLRAILKDKYGTIMKSTIKEWKGITTNDVWIGFSQFFNYQRGSTILTKLASNTREGWKLEIVSFSKKGYYK